ncbi:YhgE/Pip domain-containing protein [Brevibacillus centrosporus]|uniref:YhgE/Pip family protein n=1 Tax=Brevibacillus centrosporus TaxID=54910 RepID=UPI003D2346EF
MRSIWQIYKTDWLNIFKVPTGVFLIVAIALLPCLYDWVNIRSVWDPYANTQGVKVAVTSQDEGATVAGQSINIGEELLKNLQHNQKLGWTFVDEAEAEKGVDTGVYYASILIPKDFSAKITGIAQGRLDRPTVIYTVNEKVNAVAPKITSSGVSAIAKEINENFTEAVSGALLKKLKEIGIEVEAQLPTIRKIEQGIFALEKNLPQIEAAGQKVLELEKKLPEIHEKAQVIPALEEKIPEINQAASYLLKIQQNWPKINEAISQILAVQDRLPQIRQAADRVQELDQRFHQVEETVNLALEKTNKALEVVTAAQDALPRIGDIAEKGAAFADQMNEFLTAHNGAWESIAPVAEQNLEFAQQAADAAALLTDRLLETNPDRWPTADEVKAVQARLTTVAKVLAHTTSLLERLNAYLPGQPLQVQIDRLQAALGKLNRQVELLGIVAKALEEGKKPLRETIEQLRQHALETNDVLGAILDNYDAQIVPRISAGIEKLRELTGTAADRLQEAKERLPDLAAILKDARAGLEFGQAELKRIQEQMPQIRAKVHELSQGLAAKVDELDRIVTTVGPLLKSSLPEIGKRLDAAASFIQNDLPYAENELRRLSDFVRNQLPQLESGVHRVAALVREDLPALERAVSEAADKLREFEGNNQFAALAKLLRGDIQAESDFLASPVQIQENRKYPIPNYGSAMSPFYGVLSLWVGATLLISLLKAEADNPGERYKPYQLYLGRLATFLTIGMFQALFITLGDIYLLEAYVADKLPFVLFAMLVSGVFVTITYTLLSVFGNVGKGLAIIFMVFQFSSSGGTFPISMTPAFFQALNPFMPFTYAISLLREGVGGILWQTAIRDILFLLGFIGISLFVALVLKRPLSGLIKKSTENAKKTKIIA